VFLCPYPECREGRCRFSEAECSTAVARALSLAVDTAPIQSRHAVDLHRAQMGHSLQVAFLQETCGVQREPSTRARRVLVVEDSADVRELWVLWFTLAVSAWRLRERPGRARTGSS
jgi:hypothetical protein